MQNPPSVHRPGGEHAPWDDAWQGTGRCGICLHFADANLLLTGDTLFAGSCGRTDFPGGSMEVLAESLKRLAAFPPETEVVPGHGASTTIGREVETNPFLA